MQFVSRGSTIAISMNYSYRATWPNPFLCHPCSALFSWQGFNPQSLQGLGETPPSTQSPLIITVSLPPSLSTAVRFILGFQASSRGENMGTSHNTYDLPVATYTKPAFHIQNKKILEKKYLHVQQSISEVPRGSIQLQQGLSDAQWQWQESFKRRH